MQRTLVFFPAHPMALWYSSSGREVFFISGNVQISWGFQGFIHAKRAICRDLRLLDLDTARRRTLWLYSEGRSSWPWSQTILICCCNVLSYLNTCFILYDPLVFMYFENSIFRWINIVCIFSSSCILYWNANFLAFCILH